MRIGVSNLLWAPDRDAAVAALLAERGIDAIDLAPTRYFAPDRPIDPAAALRVEAFWRERGIAIVGLQSLLHGVPGLALFGEAASRAALGERIERAIALATRLGATQLVFGSWQNRRRGGLPLAAAVDLAARFFRPLAERAHDHGIRLGIEPIFAGYGNDFLTDHDEAATLVEAVAHPGMGLVLDVGCAGLAGEDLAEVLRRHGPRIGHVQLAERALAPLSAANPWHAQAGPLLAAALPGRVACIEALVPPEDDPLAAIARSLDVAQRWYARSGPEAAGSSEQRTRA